jgi:hypothetical protein
MSTLNLQRFGKTIEDLRKVVNSYMRWDVNGDDFKVSKEHGFEDAVREKLESENFKVLVKRNVRNTEKLLEEKLFAEDVEGKIPDIAVVFGDKVALLELKYHNDITKYDQDEDKIKKYLPREKCIASGVLFLDYKYHEGWTLCMKGNDAKYYYYWQLLEK